MSRFKHCKSCRSMLFVLLSIFAVAMLAGFDVEKGGYVRINHEDATVAGSFVPEGPLKLEGQENICCFRYEDSSDNYFNMPKYTYQEKAGADRYLYVRGADEIFKDGLNEGELLTLKCADLGEKAVGVDEDGNVVTVRVLKLVSWENLSHSGLSAQKLHDRKILNAEGLATVFVEDCDFLSGSFDMGIYEFEILHSSLPEFQGKKILILCPKDFYAFLLENDMGVNLRGIIGVEGMERDGNQLWSIISPVTLDYDNISVETRENLISYYGGGIALEVGDVKKPGPILVAFVILLLALGEGVFLVVRKAAMKKEQK